MEILVDGKVKNLNFWLNGQDFALDHLVFDLNMVWLEDQEIYSCSKEVFDFWETAFSNFEKVEELKKERGDKNLCLQIELDHEFNGDFLEKSKHFLKIFSDQDLIKRYKDFYSVE